MDHLSKIHFNTLYYCHYLTWAICLLVVKTKLFIFSDNNFALASLFILWFNHHSMVPGAVGITMRFCWERNKKERQKSLLFTKPHKKSPS